MADIHTVTLTGRVGQDPEFKQVGETDLATFSLAVEQYRGKNREADTAWWRCNLWGARSKVAEYIKTGMRLTVVGQLMVDTVQKGDEKKYYYHVDVDDLILPDKDKDTSGEKTQKKARSTAKKKGTTAKRKPKKDGLPF